MLAPDPDQVFLDKVSLPLARRLVDELKLPANQAKFRPALVLAVQELSSGGLNAEAQSQLEKDPSLHALVDGVLAVLKCAVRLRVKETDVLKDLIMFAFPKPCADLLSQTVKERRQQLEEQAGHHLEAFPTLKSLEWRVDVTISTTSLSRAFMPTVLMQLTLSDKSMYTFELSIDRFHQLRYNVAKALKALQDLKQHPTLLREM